MIPSGEVALAHVFDPSKDDVEQWIAEPKLDGVRCILFQGYALTRTGKPIPSVSDLARHFAPLPWALDGELLLPGADFEGTVGRVRQTRELAEELVFHVFDAIPACDEDRAATFLQRRAGLAAAGVTRHPRVKLTPMEAVSAFTNGAHGACDHFTKLGFEGVMLKNPDAPYTPGRSRAVLKLKPWFDTNATVLEAIAGEGKHAGRLGALVIRTEGGIVCKVGTGFSDAERVALWANRDALPGTIVEICYQELTKRGALRFPTFRRVRGDL